MPFCYLVTSTFLDLTILTWNFVGGIDFALYTQKEGSTKNLWTIWGAPQVTLEQFTTVFYAMPTAKWNIWIMILHCCNLDRTEAKTEIYGGAHKYKLVVTSSFWVHWKGQNRSSSTAQIFYWWCLCTTVDECGVALNPFTFCLPSVCMLPFCWLI